MGSPAPIAVTSIVVLEIAEAAVELIQTCRSD